MLTPCSNHVTVKPLICEHADTVDIPVLCNAYAPSHSLCLEFRSLCLKNDSVCFYHLTGECKSETGVKVAVHSLIQNLDWHCSSNPSLIFFCSLLLQCDLAKNFLLLASYQLNKNRSVLEGLQSLVWVMALSPASDLLPCPSDSVVGRIKQWCVQKRSALEDGVKDAEE